VRICLATIFAGTRPPSIILSWAIRFASTLASALLIGLPRDHIRAIEAAEKSNRPASVRRAELFLEENAATAVGPTDVARAAGVSARALQLALHCD
jgi:hypothetical protein